MAQLTCPHCQNIFQLDLSVRADELACPACGGAVISPSAPPPRQVALEPQEPPLPEQPAPMQVIAVEAVAAPPAVDPLPPPEINAPQPAAPFAAAEPAPAADRPAEEHDWNSRTRRHYSSEERASKRFVKNVIVWTVCAIVLILLMLFFLKR